MRDLSSPIERGVKCSKCERGAVARVKYAKLNLCEDHFKEYVEKRFVEFLEKRKVLEGVRKVVVAVSGGKDSLSLLHMLAKYKDKLGLEEIYGIHIDLGLGASSEEAREVVLENCEKLGVKCLVLDLRSLIGYSLAELSAISRRPPCSVCGTVKRYLANLVAVELGADAIAFGHHLDDILKYAIKDLLVEGRADMIKLSPVSEGIRGLLASKIKPLYEIYESDLELYARHAGIRTVKSSCPFKYEDFITRSIREMLDKIELEAPGFKLGLIRRLTTSWREGPPAGVASCKYCGMPSSGEVCSFCKITARAVGKPLGPEARAKVRELVGAFAARGSA